MSDDRIRCETCCLASLGKKRCMELDLHVDLQLPRRCVHYIPSIGDPDTRSGRDRWPGLEHEILKARRENLVHFLGEKRADKVMPDVPDFRPKG